MRFCYKCGKQLTDDSKFCNSCGTPVNSTHSSSSTSNCPNCGKAFNPFDSVCSACGTARPRNTYKSPVKQLCEDLQKIENQRKNRTFWNDLGDKITKKTINVIDEQKINLIINFPLPSTIEDLCELAILASTNMGSSTNPSANSIEGTWAMKLEQAYEKAKIYFGSSSEFAKIKNLYDDKFVKPKQEGKRKSNLSILVFGLLIAFFLIMSIIMTILES